MGYDTDIEGCFHLDKPLDKATADLIKGLCSTRRMKRDLTKLGMSKEEADDYGIEGEFYIPPKTNLFGMDRDASIIDFNTPPSTQPNLWCKWIYDESQNCIKWNGAEKFYKPELWIKYLVENILDPGYKVNGKATFSCQYIDESGEIIIDDNKVTIIYAKSREENWDTFF